MKDINNYINESAQPKYCVNVYIQGVGNDRKLTNDWKSLVNSEWCKKAKYWEVLDMKSSNFADIEGLIAWHGEGGYFANIYNASKNPDKAESWETVVKGKELEKLEKCKQ